MHDCISKEDSIRMSFFSFWLIPLQAASSPNFFNMGGRILERCEWELWAAFVGSLSQIAHSVTHIAPFKAVLTPKSLNPFSSLSIFLWLFQVKD